MESERIELVHKIQFAVEAGFAHYNEAAGPVAKIAV